MEQKNDLNKTLLYAVIGLSAVVVLGIGVLIGTLLSPKGTTTEEVAETPSTEIEAEQTAAEEAEKIAAEEAAKEKTYGFYPSFYVKKTSYTVSHEDRMHAIAIYTDRHTEVKRAWTDSNWLEEEDIEDGDYRFHVKENDDEDSRSGKLFLKDDKGRMITIYVRQRGER